MLGPTGQSHSLALTFPDSAQFVKNRLSSVEDQLVGIHADIAGLNRRADRIDERLTRIERKNDLVEDRVG